MGWAAGTGVTPMMPADEVGSRPNFAVDTSAQATPWVSVKRKVLRHHLQQIHNAKISPVVFERDLRVTVLSEDQALFVASPVLATDVLPWRVGMKGKQVGKWKKALGNLFGKFVRVRLHLHTAASGTHRGMPRQHLEVRGEIRSGDRVQVRMPALLSPREAATRVPARKTMMVLDALEKGTVHALPREVGLGVQTAKKLIDANLITVRVRPEGSEIQVGATSGQYAIAALPEVSCDAAYEVTVLADALASALKSVEDWNDVRLILTGQDSILAVREEGWTYMLSPLV